MNGMYNQCCYIALIKLLCLERQLILAYLDLTIAKNPQEVVSSDGLFSHNNYALTKLHFLNNAITSFNNCYDTVLQIVYFVFEFTPQIFTKTDYDKYVKSCFWEKRKKSIKEVMKLFVEQNPKHNKFFDTLCDFYETKGGQIRKIANAIKHHGGIATAETQIPTYGAYTINISEDSKYASLVFDTNNIIAASNNGDSDIFSPINVLPKIINIDETIEVLEKHTSYIYDFAHYLFRYSGLYKATENKFFSNKTFHPTFSIINDTEDK